MEATMTQLEKPRIGHRFHASAAVGRYRIPPGMLLVCCLALAPIRAPAQDNLATGKIPPRFDFQHEVGQTDKRQQVVTVEIFPQGESIKTWTELITIQSLGKKKHPPPRDAVEGTRQMLLERCPNLMWNEIEAKGEDILYEWRIENCAAAPDQHELARYLANKSTVFRVAYTVKTKQLSPEEREQWITWLRAAHLTK
jgi:hypothetical protein